MYSGESFKLKIFWRKSGVLQYNLNFRGLHAYSRDENIMEDKVSKIMSH